MRSPDMKPFAETVPPSRAIRVRGARQFSILLPPGFFVRVLTSRSTWLCPHCLIVRHFTRLSFSQPVLSSVSCDIHGQLQPAPNPQFIEDAAHVILDDLLAGVQQLADLTVG